MPTPSPAICRAGCPAQLPRRERGNLLFVGDHLARSVRGVPCAPPPVTIEIDPVHGFTDYLSGAGQWLTFLKIQWG